MTDKVKLHQIERKYPQWRHYIQTSKVPNSRKLYYIRHYHTHLRETSKHNSKRPKQKIYQGRSQTRRYLRLGGQKAKKNVRNWCKTREKMLLNE